MLLPLPALRRDTSLTAVKWFGNHLEELTNDSLAPYKCVSLHELCASTLRSDFFDT